MSEAAPAEAQRQRGGFGFNAPSIVLPVELLGGTEGVNALKESAKQEPETPTPPAAKPLFSGGGDSGFMKSNFAPQDKVGIPESDDWWFAPQSGTQQTSPAQHGSTSTTNAGGLSRMFGSPAPESDRSEEVGGPTIPSYSLFDAAPPIAPEVPSDTFAPADFGGSPMMGPMDRPAFPTLDDTTDVMVPASNFSQTPEASTFTTGDVEAIPSIEVDTTPSGGVNWQTTPYETGPVPTTGADPMAIAAEMRRALSDEPLLPAGFNEAPQKDAAEFWGSSVRKRCRQRR